MFHEQTSSSTECFLTKHVQTRLEASFPFTYKSSTSTVKVVYLSNLVGFKQPKGEALTRKVW